MSPLLAVAGLLAVSPGGNKFGPDLENLAFSPASKPTTVSPASNSPPSTNSLNLIVLTILTPSENLEVQAVKYHHLTCLNRL